MSLTDPPGTHEHPADYRSFMARFPTGVSIVTAYDSDGRPWGMTCSSVCSVTLTPPTLIVCLRVGSPTTAAVLQSAAFAVNLLHHRATASAQLFASGAPDRFDRVDWQPVPDAAGPHLRADAHSIADCRVTEHHVVGDHVVFLGEVTDVVHPSVHEPLLYGLRRFAAWTSG